MRTRTTVTAVAVFAMLTNTACQDPKLSDEECDWGITCPHGSSCHEATMQCVTAEQLEACVGMADSSPCTYSGSGGHDVCEGGACVGPTIIVTGDIGPLAMNATHLFWFQMGESADGSPMNNGGIFRVSLSGGVPELVVSDVSRPCHVATKEGRLYWGGGSGISWVPTDGREMPRSIGLPCEPSPAACDIWSSAFAVSASDVYWVTASIGDFDCTATIRGRSLEGGSTRALPSSRRTP